MTRASWLARFSAIGIFVLALMLAACGGSSSSSSSSSSGKAGTFVGTVPGTDAFIALSTPGDGTSLSYVCDSKQTATWFSGPVTNNAIALTAANGDKLNATLAASGAKGTVTLSGKDYPFTAALRSGDAGLFRAEGSGNGVSTVAGWIITNDGQQRGVDADKGAAGEVQLRPAPVLNVTQPTVTHPQIGQWTAKRVGPERDDFK